MVGRDDADPLAAARRQMIDHDLAARGITDRVVLDAMARVPREAFVDADQREAAYVDRPLPIGQGQTISQPFIVAFMTQALGLRATDRVLDVGTGSGYAAAVLAQIAAEVWSIERHASLAELAASRLAELGVRNVHVITGDGTRGYPDAAPYDAIAVAASSGSIPPALVDQLADGGRMVLPVGPDGRGQRLVRVVRRGDSLDEEKLLDVRFVPLVPD